MKVSLCLIMLLVCTATLHAQEAPADTVATEEEYQYLENSDDDADGAVTDTDDETPGVTHDLVSPHRLPTTQKQAREKMDIRKFDDKQWKEVVGTETFQEKPDKPKKQQEKSDANKSSEPFRMPELPWGGAGLQVIAYVVVIALIVGLVYLFTKDLRFKVKVKPVELQTEDLTAAVENIEHIEVATPLHKALADGNLKLATRLYFLDLLKKLHEAGIIAWKKDKTNRDYLTEIYTKAYHYEAIRNLTLAYERVWYGEHALTHEAYQQLFADFEAIYQTINTPAAA